MKIHTFIYLSASQLYVNVQRITCTFRDNFLSQKMSNESFGNKIKVCIIGAGAAGICAAHLLKESGDFVFHIYEQTNLIGGTWNYTDDTGKDANGMPIHSSMYKNMRTNLPLEIMEFPDFSSSSQTSFVHHSEVIKYLNDYVEHFQIKPFILFNHSVLNVSREDNSWTVKINDLKNSKIFNKIYDSIIVCNGRYSKPKYPQLNGIENFKGRVTHSHDYRTPEVYANEIVLVLGAGPSGIDIALEVSETAKLVILCHSKTQIRNLPENIKQEISTIKHIFSNRIEFLNNCTYENVNSIIYATGYKYDYNFLDKNSGISVSKNERVKGLYLHLINTSHPTMAILAIQKTILPFPLYHQQILFFIKCLKKEIILPSKEQMDNDTQKDFEEILSLGLPEAYAHSAGNGRIWTYDDTISRIGNLKPIRCVTRKLYDYLHKQRTENIAKYKDLNFKIINDNDFITK